LLPYTTRFRSPVRSIALLGRATRRGVPVDEVEVEMAVAIVVEPPRAAGHRLEEDLLAACAGRMDPVDAGRVGHVEKGGTVGPDGRNREHGDDHREERGGADRGA